MAQFPQLGSSRIVAYSEIVQSVHFHRTILHWRILQGFPSATLVCFFSDQLFLALSLFYFLRCSKNGHHPLQDLAISDSKPHLKYKSLIILPLFSNTLLETKHKNLTKKSHNFNFFFFAPLFSNFLM